MVIGKSHEIGKADAMARLESLGLPSRPFFYPLTSLPAYPGLEEKHRQLNPVSYDISSRGINLPGALIMTEDQVDAVCKGVRTILSRD
jgi:perosamine synthetase